MQLEHRLGEVQHVGSESNFVSKLTLQIPSTLCLLSIGRVRVFCIGK